jgi:hypothetical protein
MSLCVGLLVSLFLSHAHTLPLCLCPPPGLSLCQSLHPPCVCLCDYLCDVCCVSLCRAVGSRRTVLHAQSRAIVDHNRSHALGSCGMFRGPVNIR